MNRQLLLKLSARRNSSLVVGGFRKYNAIASAASCLSCHHPGFSSAVPADDNNNNTRKRIIMMLSTSLKHSNEVVGTFGTLNDDNMLYHHMSNEQPRLKWEFFHGKIPILQQDLSNSDNGNKQPSTTKEAVVDRTTRPLNKDGSSISGIASTDNDDNDTIDSKGGGVSSGGTDFTTDVPRTSLLMELTDRVGVLHDVLKYFWKYDVNICRIESRPKKLGSQFDFFVDLEGSTDDANVRQLLQSLEKITNGLLILDEKRVHWFPRHISELDKIVDRTLDAGSDLESDHPGFLDTTYRKRRDELTNIAKQHTWDRPIPRVEYTPEETSVWTAVWDKMQPLLEKHACQEYKVAFQQMTEHCGYSRERIPQQQDISEYLLMRTNFRMRPVAGLLSSRDFLNGLAFRVFFSTQYIRHHSKPLYTPEPDICHELLGHAPMFADRDFADFSQEIGLASLGASDEDVDKLAHCYWHSVEFGLCRENGENKAYGAGLLSSFGELEYACGDSPSEDGKHPQFLPWDPEVAAKQEFPITTYQPIYFLAETLQDAKQKMRSYCENLPRPFFALYNPRTNSVHIDRPVKRCKGVPQGVNSD